jgi:hypothetical protein
LDLGLEFRVFPPEVGNYLRAVTQHIPVEDLPLLQYRAACAACIQERGRRYFRWGQSTLPLTMPPDPLGSGHRLVDSRAAHRRLLSRYIPHCNGNSAPVKKGSGPDNPGFDFIGLFQPVAQDFLILPTPAQSPKCLFGRTKSTYPRVFGGENLPGIRIPGRFRGPPGAPEDSTWGLSPLAAHGRTRSKLMASALQKEDPARDLSPGRADRKPLRRYFRAVSAPR